VCGVREHVFKGEDWVLQFLEYLAEKRVGINNITCVGHSARGYDTHFVLRTMLNGKKWSPEIMKGCQLLSIKYKNLRFIDSLNFLPMALAKLPHAIDLQLRDISSTFLTPQVIRIIPVLCLPRRSMG